MKLVTGAVLLLAAEHAYAHAQLAQYPNHESASSVLIPASLILLVMGMLMLIWGLLSEARSSTKT